MSYKIKHIILSRILLLALILPPLWQLEHVFDNDHGIVFQQDNDSIHNIYDNSCASLHKQFQFHSVFSLFIYQTLEIDFPILKNTILPRKPYVYKLHDFALRAPPSLA